MCTDNMPSGTAMALGDVITIRGGTTVEVINTDAEGRLVMADALVLATEDGVDAIVDMATLTGACMRALGTQVAGVMGNDAALIDQIEAAAATTDEPVWELPLERRYRRELDSTVADLRNLGRRQSPGRSQQGCSSPSSSATRRGPTSTSPEPPSRPATPAGRPLVARDSAAGCCCSSRSTSRAASSERRRSRS